MKNIKNFDQFNEANKPGIELDEISTKVLDYMKDACCPVTPMQIATAVGNVKIADVKNILSKAQKDGIIVKKDLKRDKFEFIQK
jgi:hypothetical protein